MLRVKDVAKLLDVGQTAVYELVAARKINHYRIGAGRGAIRFEREDVEAFKRSARVEAAKAEEKKGRIDAETGYVCKFIDPRKIGG